MGIITDELRILFSVNGAQGYVNAMNEVSRVTDGFGTSAGKLMSTLGKLVSVAAIVKFSKQCISAASDLQEVANVMNVTFGDSAAIVDKWAKTAASSFGLSETSAKRYIGTYGIMATQFGYTREQAANMGIELTKLTGDVASFYNITDELAAVKLKSVFTGETETLKELGVVMTEVNLNAYAMEKGLGKTLKEMTEHEKVALRYSFVMDRLSHAQGDFARTSDGWANSVRLLKLNLENLKIQIGNELLPVAGQGIALINQGLRVISPVLIAVARTVRLYGEAWKNASAQTKGYVKAALSIVAMMAVVPKVIAGIRTAVKFLTMDILTLGGALKALAGIAGILLMAKAFSDLTKSVSEMRNTADTTETISDIGDSAAISSDAVNELSEAMGGLTDTTEELDTFLASFDEVNKVGGNKTLMSNFVNSDDLNNILGVADGLDDIQTEIDQLNSSLSGIEVPDVGKETILDPAWWQQKMTFIKGFSKTLLNPSEFWDNWRIGIKEIIPALQELGINIDESVERWFQENFPEWTKFWENFGSKVFDVLEPVFKQLKTWGSEFAEAWKTGIDEISEKLDSLWKKYESTGFFKFWQNVGANAYDVINPEPITDNGHGGTGRRRYASGGYPNKGSLFIAGETGAELIGNFGSSQTKVINQSQITNNNTQQPIQFQPTIMIDGRKITATVIDSINSMTRSSGKSPLIELGG